VSSRKLSVRKQCDLRYRACPTDKFYTIAN
jgi:hypothetical protein